MATITTTSSDFQNLIYSHAIDNKKQTYWEEFLSGITAQQMPQYEKIQSAYTTKATEAERETAYDISAAYANYKKNQLALMANQNVGSGYKAQQLEDLDIAYNEAFDYYKNNLASTLGTLEAGKETALGELGASRQRAIGQEQEDITQRANYLSELQNKIFAHIGDTELEKWVQPISEGGYGYYDVSYGGDGTAVYSLTGYGENYWDKFFNNPSQQDMTFWNNLQQTNKDLYDWAMNNMNDIRNYMGNITSENTEYTGDDALYNQAQRMEDYYKKYYAGDAEQPKFSSEQDRISYYDSKIKAQEESEYAVEDYSNVKNKLNRLYSTYNANAYRTGVTARTIATDLNNAYGSKVVTANGLNSVTIDTKYLTRDQYERLTGKTIDYSANWRNTTITIDVSKAAKAVALMKKLSGK